MEIKDTGSNSMDSIVESFKKNIDERIEEYRGYYTVVHL